MTKFYFFVSTVVLVGLSLTSFVVKNNDDELKPVVTSKKTRVNFKLRGTGSKNIAVKIGIGYQVGSGSCCSTVSPNSTNGFSGEVGDVVYDSERKRVIVKIYEGLEGQTLELKDYYWLQNFLKLRAVCFGSFFCFEITTMILKVSLSENF